MDVHDGLRPADSEQQNQTVKIMNDAIQCFPFMIVLMTDTYGFKVSQGIDSHADSRDPLSLHKQKSWTGLTEVILESGPLNEITGSMWKTIAIYRSGNDRNSEMSYNDDGTFELHSDDVKQGRLLQRMKNSDNVVFKKVENSSKEMVKTIEREVMKLLKKCCPARPELEHMTDDWRHDYLEHDFRIASYSFLHSTDLGYDECGREPNGYEISPLPAMLNCRRWLWIEFHTVILETSLLTVE